MAITPPKERDTMQQYIVEVVIGTEYLLLIEANNESQAHDIARQYNDNEPNSYGNVSQLEHDAGRAVVSVSEFNHPPCSECDEAKLDCEANSVETGEIVQTFEELRAHYTKVNDDTARHLAIVIDGYLTHVVSPCNRYSRA